EASGDDHSSVLGERIGDRVERLPYRLVDEPAGVDDDEIRACVVADDLVALRAQAREDALGVHRGFRAAERNEADARGSSRTASPGRARIHVHRQAQAKTPPGGGILLLLA